jgi:hypothetical protein
VCAGPCYVCACLVGQQGQQQQQHRVPHCLTYKWCLATA